MSAPAGTGVGIAAALGAATVPRRAVLGGGAALGTRLLAPKGFQPAVAGRAPALARGPAVSRNPAVFFTDPATLHEFTAAAGGRFHCAPMAPQRRNQVLFDWLGGVL
jgi:hypothetical protein